MHKVQLMSSRRAVLRASAIMLAALASTRLPLAGREAAGQEALAPTLAIDLTSEPATLDPAKT